MAWVLAATALSASPWQLPEAREVRLGGALGEAYQRGVERLSQDPYRSAAYLRSDFSFETNRVFVNYSGDISGRFIELASLMSLPGRMTPATLPEVLRDLGRYQKDDGHFGRDVHWTEPLEPENPNARLLPIFWGNSRLLVGLIEAYLAFGRPDLLEAAKRMGDFYIATAGRFLDPTREAEYRSTGSYAAGYVTDYFPAIEGLTRLYQVTKDPRYLEQAGRMAAFFARFDTLPIDHSHGNLITHYGLLLLHEITGKPEYLSRPRQRWRQAVEGGYVWPMGGVGEKFRVSYDKDEGCSEADWLRVSLKLWQITGDTSYLHLAERLIRNHYAMNRTANGGYGHHNFVCDADGPLLMKPEFTEAVWCCTFHGSLGLHTLKRYVVVGSDRGVFLNFPFDVTAPVSTSNGVWQVAMSCQEEPGALTCSIRLTSADGSRPLPLLFMRPPAWMEGVAVTDARGHPANLPAEGGYLRLPSEWARTGELRARFEFAPRVEDRRLTRLALESGTLKRHRGVTFHDGPRLLLATSDQPRPVLVARLGRDGRLLLPRDANGDLHATVVSSIDASEADLAALAKQAPRLSLLPWARTRRDAPAAFVFDLIAVPESHPLAETLKP